MLSPGQHTLTIQPDSNDLYKHCILVKLTDSSAKAIEDYLKSKNPFLKKPCIKFQKDKEKEKGEVLFPIESKSNDSVSNESQFKKFVFSISSTKESNKIDSSASCECICYTNSKLKTIGTLEQKLTIQGNEEVFLATKEKVNTVEQEHKNNSTIEIKQPVSRNSLTNFNASRPKPTINSSSSTSKLFNNVTSPSTTVTTTNATMDTTGKPKIIDRSLKERIIHLLATKPYNKAELLIRLNKDNPLSDKDKESLESIIQSVATLNMKNSNYEILSEVLLNDVRKDWPFYNDAHRIMVKNNISKAKLSANSSLNTPNNSLNTKLNSSSTLNTNNKHSAFVSIPQSNINNKLGSSSNLHRGMTPQTTAKNEFFSMSPNSDDLLSDNDTSNKKFSNEKEPSPVKKYSKKIDTGATKERTQLEEFYRKIETKKQYEQYQSDFDQSYEEYLELFKYIESITKIFDSLKTSLALISDQNSKEFQERKNEIFKEYNEKNNDDYVKKKEKYNSLHLKLSIISDRIKQYKASQTE